MKPLCLRSSPLLLPLLLATVSALSALSAGVGCSSITQFERDRTELKGEVPTGLGRHVEVHVDAPRGDVTGALFVALEREFLGQDLFDSVALVDSSHASAAGDRPAAGLWVTFLDLRSDELYDGFLLNSAYGARYELQIELRDADDARVLHGLVTAVGIDDVTDLEYLGPTKREDVRLAGINDAAVKISRGLRQAADRRAHKALRALPEVGLPVGVAPLKVSVLGFDDPPKARRRRGELFTERLTEGLSWLGRDFDVTPHQRAQRAVEREPPKGFGGIDDYEVALIGRHLPETRVFVVGRLKLTGGRVEAEAQVLDRGGQVLLTREAAAEGLGALSVAAVELARQLGEGLQTAPIPSDE